MNFGAKNPIFRRSADFECAPGSSPGHIRNARIDEIRVFVSLPSTLVVTSSLHAYLVEALCRGGGSGQGKSTKLLTQMNQADPSSLGWMDGCDACAHDFLTFQGRFG